MESWVEPPAQVDESFAIQNNMFWIILNFACKEECLASIEQNIEYDLYFCTSNCVVFLTLFK